jgi:hypothetical protein
MTPTIPVEALPVVLALDPIVIAFVKANLVTIGLILGLFKGLAKITTGTTDDKIATLLTNLFLSIKPGKNNGGAKTTAITKDNVLEASDERRKYP